jgi:hypothetical protein
VTALTPRMYLYKSKTIDRDSSYTCKRQLGKVKRGKIFKEFIRSAVL